jgi:hypothetical protein
MEEVVTIKDPTYSTKIKLPTAHQAKDHHGEEALDGRSLRVYHVYLMEQLQGKLCRDVPVENYME